MIPPWQLEHLFAVCQVGAESTLKNDVMQRMPGVRPGFSRPGFVTFNLPQPCNDPERFQWWSPWARTGGFSLGQVQGVDDQDCARQTWSQEGVRALLENRRLGDLHVWPRDARGPGDGDFEPGPNDHSRSALDALRATVPDNVSLDSLRPDARGKWTLDVIVLDAGHWWIGCHRKSSRVDCWPGGVPSVDLPDYALSRAYLKMAEALAWSSMPLAKGDRVAELGCAPGGASQALLDAGLYVVGVDPADMDPKLLANPHFTHVQRRTKQLSKAALEHVQWLCADMNVAPQVTLDAVEEIVRHKCPGIRGMLLTLKLPTWDAVDHLSEYIQRIQSWGYRDVRVRQLAFNRQEVCLAVLKTRGQRRFVRQRGRQLRVDAAHSAAPPPQGQHG